MTFLESIGFTTDTIRQVTAESLLIFDLGLLCFIIAHLRQEVKAKGWIATRQELGNQAAIAVGVHIVGLSLIRSWTTYLYWSGVGPAIANDASSELYAMPLAGLVIAVIGMACCIRIFSPVRWGNWGWVLTFMAAIGFVGWMQSSA